MSPNSGCSHPAHPQIAIDTFGGADRTLSHRKAGGYATQPAAQPEQGHPESGAPGPVPVRLPVGTGDVEHARGTQKGDQATAALLPDLVPELVGDRLEHPFRQREEFRHRRPRRQQVPQDIAGDRAVPTVQSTLCSAVRARRATLWGGRGPAPARG